MTKDFRAGMLYVFDQVYISFVGTVLQAVWRKTTLNYIGSIIDKTKTVEELRQEAVRNYPAFNKGLK